MPATKLESWLIRAVLLLAAAGGDVPQGRDLKEAGAFLAEKGLSALARVDYDQARPLLDELLGCCSRMIGGVKERCTPEGMDAYIEDVTTLFKLRAEALKVNLGFLSEGLGGLLPSPVRPAGEPQ